LPPTTVDIPSDILNFVDNLIEGGFARSRREIVVDALKHYRDFTMYDWEPNRIVVRELRRALLTQKSLEQLTLGMTEQELYEAGKRMSQTLLDSMLATWGKNPRKPENHQLALELLSGIGWGKFNLGDGRIVINAPFLSKHLMRGYLEAGLGIKLNLIQTVEDLAILAIEGRPTVG
jgi:Arc/MetJ-type ribon-helix-helix transcriptional regulator